MIARVSLVMLRLTLIAVVVAFRLVMAATVVGVCYHYPPLAVLVVVLLLARLRKRRSAGRATSHGSARIASHRDLIDASLLGKRGVILGRVGFDIPASLMVAIAGLFDRKLGSADACHQMVAAAGLGGKQKPMIRVQSITHIMTVAAAGKGKTVSVLVPNLLSYEGNVVVTDPKYELRHLTGEFRRKRFGHRVVTLDPFDLAAMHGGKPLPSDGLNPLDFIDPASDEFLDQCRDVASLLVVRKGTESERHWDDMAELVLTGVTSFVCACEDQPEIRNLCTVRGIVASRTRFTRSVEVMQKVEGFGGVVKRLGEQLAVLADKELNGVLTTLGRHLAFLDSVAVARNVSKSTFDPADLRKTAMSVYLCLPHDRLSSLAGLQRLWVGTILRRITYRQVTEAAPVLLLLDEAGNLGHMQILEDAVTLMRGMGVRCWFFYQSIGQLAKCFGERSSVILDNIDTQQYFGITAYESAETISKRIGDTTITVTSDNQTGSRSHPVYGWLATLHNGDGKSTPQPDNVTSGWSVTHSDTGRRLLKPEEIITLPEDVAIVFHRNMPVIMGRLFRYYSDPAFRRITGGRRRRRIASKRLWLAAGVLALVALVVCDVPLFRLFGL